MDGLRERQTVSEKNQSDSQTETDGKSAEGQTDRDGDKGTDRRRDRKTEKDG